MAVIDAAGQIGGTARISGGGICIAGSPVQAAHGICDSPETALEDWLAVGGPSADAAWAQRYLEASVPEVFDYLTVAGVHWLGARPQEGNREPRWHAPAGGGRRAHQRAGGAGRRDARPQPVQWSRGRPGRVTQAVLEAADEFRE